MESRKCIYCLEEKPISEFNREHVISRFMGTYENAYVLGDAQVCKACNSYFCDNMENILSFDSLEGLLRTENLQKPMKHKRAIGMSRLKVTGNNDIFKGLTLYISSSPNNPNNIQIETAPAIGLILDENQHLYEYFSLESLPICDDTIRARMAFSNKPIVVFGYDEPEVSEALKNHGYDLSKAKYNGNLALADMTEEQSLSTEINCKVDSLLQRLALKNLFNYICYTYGKDYILQPNFDNLRNYVRYGTLTAPLQSFINSGGIKKIPGLVNDCHAVGLAWTVIGEQIHLCGFVSWFDSITYVFDLMPVKTGQFNFLNNVKCVICDNHRRVLTEAEYLTVLDWPGTNKKIGFLDRNFQPIDLDEHSTTEQ